MTTPKNLTDLRYEENVIHLRQGDIVEAKANSFFHELFAKKEVTVRFLFAEDDKKVFEAYQDSGSVDYLYIIQSKF